MAADKSITDTAAFMISKLGETVTGRFAHRLEPLGLRPRHLGVLALLSTAPAPQVELARRLEVTPSVVVDMVDELEALGAVLRVRDSADRRRQVVELTAPGRSLLKRSTALAAELDHELLATLPARERAALPDALRRLWAGTRTHHP